MPCADDSALFNDGIGTDIKLPVVVLEDDKVAPGPGWLEIGGMRTLAIHAAAPGPQAEAELR